MKKLISFLSLSAIALSACTKPAGDGDPIKIGLITPLTGDVASLGNDIMHGAKLKMEEINAAGGINGRPIELILEDGRCAGPDAVGAAQKLVNIDKVVAIHGAGCSGESMASAPIANAAKVVMMSPSSSSPDLTEAGEYFFRTYPNDALKTSAMARFFEQKGYNKIAIIGENTDFCEAFRASLKADVGENKVVFDEAVVPDTKDFRTLMTRLKEVDFDVLVTNAQTPPVGAAMLNHMREQGIEQLAIGQDVMDTAAVIELAPDASEGLHVINVQTIGDDTEFGKKFTAKFGKPQANMAWAAYGYDTLGVLAQGIGSAGTEDPALKDYFNSMKKYKGVVGDISFDENGDVKGVSYALKEAKGGEFVKISDVVVD